MLGHQAAYVDHLLDVVERERVDLRRRRRRRLRPGAPAGRRRRAWPTRPSPGWPASRAQVVVTSGNHDSAHRLGFGSRLIDAAGVFIRTDAAAVGTPGAARRRRTAPVAVYGIPYLDPDTLREPWGLAGRSHEAALGEAMARVRADLAAGGRHPLRGAGPRLRRRRRSPASPSATSASAASRWCRPALFDGVDYTALGHLHGRHTLTDTVRYSGSPLAYSFSEADHRKGTWLVELGAAGFAAAEFVDAPVPRPLARISGDLETC